MFTCNPTLKTLVKYIIIIINVIVMYIHMKKEEIFIFKIHLLLFVVICLFLVIFIEQY